MKALMKVSLLNHKIAVHACLKSGFMLKYEISTNIVPGKHHLMCWPMCLLHTPVFFMWCQEHFICLFDLILYLPSTIFQLNRDRSSWVEPVLS